MTAGEAERIVHGVDAQFWSVVTSGRFGGFRDVEAMGITRYTEACVWLETEPRREVPRG